MKQSTRLASLPEASDSDEVSAAPGPAPRPIAAGSPIRLLVSACLLGDEVRYDGQHKYDAFLVEMLGPFVEWERVCPESDCGLPTPRPSMHLVGDPRAPRLVSRTGVDLTEQMRRFTEERLRELEGVELCGRVCKKDSPSSGMTRVKIYNESGMAERVGAGLFTAAFVARFPLVPVEEEGRLHDARLRESFIERVFCRRRWLDLVAALAQRSTPKKVTDVLQHMLGFFKDQLNRDDKAELLESIDAYRNALMPPIVPLTSSTTTFASTRSPTWLARSSCRPIRRS